MKGDLAKRGALLAAAALLAVACASPPPSAGGVADPWQAWNRPVFKFNTKVDDYVLAPVAHGWIFITPQLVRDSVGRFFFNASFPSRFVSSVGQGEALKALTEVGRFLVNTTIGIGGLLDPATKIGLARYDEDIGQMFGRWGIPPGPYWVIPLLGPSDPRDAVGRLGDAVLNPFFWLPPFWLPYATGALNVVNSRALADKQIQNARRTALDYYVFVRDAFLQNRASAVRDANTPAQAGTGAYDLYSAPGDYDLPEEPKTDAPTK
jgi:phospholipid-binding lipoprotein MlaA